MMKLKTIVYNRMKYLGNTLIQYIWDFLYKTLLEEIKNIWMYWERYNDCGLEN